MNVRLVIAGGGVAGLMVVGALLPVGAANAQSQAEQLLRQVLPGMTEGDEPERDRRRGDGALDDQLAERARDACEDAAVSRDLDDVDIDDVRAKARDTVEVRMRAEDRGERLRITCLYDDDERQAFLSN